MVDKLNTPLSGPNYVIFSSSHAVAHVTLSPVKIAVLESAGMVTLQVIRSRDITGPSRVYFNTRPTATTPAAGEWPTNDQSQLEAKCTIDLHIYDLITRYIQGLFLNAIIASVIFCTVPVVSFPGSPLTPKKNKKFLFYFLSGRRKSLGTWLFFQEISRTHVT